MFVQFYTLNITHVATFAQSSNLQNLNYMEKGVLFKLRLHADTLNNNLLHVF